MANPLLEDYLPAAADVTPEMAAAVRSRLASLWLLQDPSADTGPNTVIGDRVLTPAAFAFAAVEEAMRRFMSDLDPDNVARGIIYNCDFVERFLANFGVYALPDVAGTGVVRLTFDTNIGSNPVELDRGLRFRTATGEPELTMFLPQEGPLELVPAGGVLAGEGNKKRLTEVGRDLFVVDIPVTTEETVEIEAGTELEMTALPENLVSAVCLTDIVNTAPSQSLAVLAGKTRDTVYAASPGQLGGLRRFVAQALPGSKLVFATGPGDDEMLRGVTNALGITVPAADVFVRGASAFLEETQLIWLDYDGVNERFTGRWYPVSTPLLMRSILWEGNEAMTLDTTVWGRSSDEDRAPLLTAAGTGLEDYWITIDLNGSEEIDVETDPSRGTGAWFLVTYLADPGVEPVRDLLMSPDNRPIGVDVLVKPPVLVRVSDLTVSYRRRHGQSLRLSTARSEIVAHVNGCGWPDRMTTAPWIDSMYYGGASAVEFSVAAEVVWTVADRWIEAGVDDPVTDYAAALAGSFEPPLVSITDTDDLTPGADESTPAQGAACGWRNVAWYIESDDITFTELS